MCTRTLLRNIGIGLWLRRQPLQTPFIRSKSVQPNDNDGSDDIQPLFNPRKAVVLTKISRFDFERRRCQSMTEAEFRGYLESKNSDYNSLLSRHHKNVAAIENVKKTLLAAGIEPKVVQRFDFSSELVRWADVIFTVGGDGTFLLAASKMLDTDKPIIGINSDPDKSEGHLCLPRSKYHAAYFGDALQRLKEGNFSWKWRQRIKITMLGNHINDDPVDIHEQIMHFPEHRFTEHVREYEQERHPVNPLLNPAPTRTLPVLALNEVFIGESLSSRVSYYEIFFDDGLGEKQKSSGITVCTGTGSSSWNFHINHISTDAVRDILNIASQYVDYKIPATPDVLQQVAHKFNESLRFDPSEPYMAYTIRDPLKNAVFRVSKPRGFAKKIQVLSRMWDACLTVDGGATYKFNDGAVATLEMAENPLRTVSFH